MYKQINPPFAIGQNVVAIATSEPLEGLQIVKGTVYTVYDCVLCKCGLWIVQLSEMRIKGMVGTLCHLDTVTEVAGAESKWFVPIEPRHITISKSLKKSADQWLEERVTEKSDAPVKVEEAV